MRCFPTFNMIPRLLVSETERITIDRLLKDFYFNKPKEYSSHTQREHTFTAYISLVEESTPQGGSFLDLGAGTGYSSTQLAQRKITVTACDLISPQALPQLREQMGREGVTLVSYEGKTLPFPSESFDTVGCFCVFEHIVFPAEVLSEISRVLKKIGKLIILSPNWGGPHVSIQALFSLLVRKKRYWQYTTISNAVTGIPRSFFWGLRVLCARSVSDYFLTVYPRMKKGELDYQSSDDDCVHLCYPLSFRKWAKKKHWRIICYNRGGGDSVAARILNTLFPTFATTNTLVLQKSVTREQGSKLPATNR